MGFLSTRVFSFLLLFGFCHSAKFLVDGGGGISWWMKNKPEVQIGDSVVFLERHNNYSLYIFKNREAFTVCNFSQATLLTKPHSNSYTWHVSRPGFFYFSFLNNGSEDACLEGKKLAIEVLHRAAPPPISSSPFFQWPFQPREGSTNLSPLSSPAPEAADREGIPFISSNPAVPLPTGEVDSATIRPLPTTTTNQQNPEQVVGFPYLLSLAAILVVMMMMMD